MKMLQSYAASLAEQQAKIISIMFVCPLGNRNPGFGRFAEFIQAACSMGYSLDSLYYIFASGAWPDNIVALFAEHSTNWPLRKSPMINDEEFDLAKYATCRVSLHSWLI